MPKPNAMWWLGYRVTSKRSGSAKCAGSRLAEPYISTTWWPASTAGPPISTSTVGDPAHVVDRRDVADELLGRDRQVGAGLERRPLLGVGDEVEDRAGDHGAGRLGAAVEEQQAVGDHGVDRQGLAVDSAVGPHRHDVVGRAACFSACSSAAAWANSIAASMPSSLK